MSASDVRVTRWRWVFFGLALAALIAVSVIWAPRLLVDTSGIPDRADALSAENDLRNTLLTGIAAFLFLFTAIFTWRQIQLTEAGQITGRYESATKLLDAKGMTQRVGGVYLLGRIAADSGRDLLIVTDLLSAFCRQTKERMPDEPQQLVVRRPDVQAALRVLGGESIEQVASRTNKQWDRLVQLSGANLEGADLKGLKLENADLCGSCLKNAEAHSVDLTYALLWEADLENARFDMATLSNAEFKDVACMKQARFSFAKLDGARFDGTDLEGADFSDAVLGNKADFREARNIERAVMERMTLDGSELWPQGYRPPQERST